MNKKLIQTFTVLLLVLFMCAAVANAATDAAKIYVNGSPSNMDAKIIDGRVYLPLDSLKSDLNINVQTDSSQNIVYISKESSVSDILSKVGPSVVGIIGNTKGNSSYYGTDGLTFGTGVVYKTEGYIITNAHVVGNMENIVVVLSNGKAYMAKLKAIDEKSDIAMIKIDKGGLTPADFGDITDIQVGESVVAIGTPLSFSLRNSATKGIISGMNRSVEGEYRFIQSDAAINSGNSGGPLVNMQGKVIGINSMKYAGSGVEGLSFTIPVDTVKYVISHFEKYGKVKRPYIGVAFLEGVAATYGLPTDEGLTVNVVEKGSPAENAGILFDDVVKLVNGVKVTTIVDFNEEMKKYLPGDKVTLIVERGNIDMEIQVICTEAVE